MTCKVCCSCANCFLKQKRSKRIPIVKMPYFLMLAVLSRRFFAFDQVKSGNVTRAFSQRQSEKDQGVPRRYSATVPLLKPIVFLFGSCLYQSSFFAVAGTRRTVSCPSVLRALLLRGRRRALLLRGRGAPPFCVSPAGRSVTASFAAFLFSGLRLRCGRFWPLWRRCPF